MQERQNYDFLDNTRHGPAQLLGKHRSTRVANCARVVRWLPETQRQQRICAACSGHHKEDCCIGFLRSDRLSVPDAEDDRDGSSPSHPAQADTVLSTVYGYKRTRTHQDVRRNKLHSTLRVRTWVRDVGAVKIAE
eukprot:1484828-Rhodomonas_salina.1